MRTDHFLAGEPPPPRWSMAASEVDAMIGMWSYDAEYLTGLQSLPPTPMDAAFIEAHRAGRSLQGPANRVKEGTLALLVRLRSAPALRHVARAIPLRWQTRVKSWLRA